MTLYLTNTTYLDWKTLGLQTTNLAVKEGRVGGFDFVAEAPGAESLGPDDRVIDCRGKLVTRSFGCGHHHIYSTLARGMPAPQKVPENFTEILQYVWWHLDKRLDLDMIEASALASAIYSAKCGVAFVIDHHASPFAVEGSLFRIAEAFDRVGIGHMLCYELSDRDGPESREAGLAETDAYLAAGNPGHVGLHASFTVGPDLLKRAVALAEKHKAGLHLHVAEDGADQDDALKKYNMRVVERLDRVGALQNPKTILAHCVHLSDEERRMVGNSGVWVVQNTESNQNNNVGLTGYSSWTDNVMLGTDGMHCDMIRSARAAFLAGQATEGLGYDAVYHRFRGVNRYLEAAGVPGDGDNNLVILDYDPPTPLTGDNFYGHFLFGLDARHVESVISQGRVIVENRRVVTVDESEVLGFAREMAVKLWSRM